MLLRIINQRSTVKRSSCDGCGAAGAVIPVQWSLRPGLPHGIDPDGIADGAAFLTAAFAESGG
jgi:hypothetical protein